MTEETKNTGLAEPLNARDDPAWWQERNKRRRERYAQDKAYRDQQTRTSRAAYRARAGSEGATDFDPRLNLPKLDAFGRVRPVMFPNGQTIDRWCMTKAEAAEVFGKSVKLFYHWVSDGRFPEAILTATDYPITRDYKHKTGVRVPQTLLVYAAEEIRAAVIALGPHLTQVRYYRKDHEREKEAVHKAVAEVRASLGITVV